MAYITYGGCHRCATRTDIIQLDIGDLCPSCLFGAINNGEVTVDARCTNCGDALDGESYCSGCSQCEDCSAIALYCEDHAVTGCYNCGDDDAQFCSVDCAVAYNGDDYRPTCAYCGDSDAYYCSTGCAVNDGNDAYCTTCEYDASETTCERCASPALAAAENIRSISDDHVETDGITFEFRI